MAQKISRKTFLKNCSYFAIGIMGFSRMLSAAENGISILNTKFPVKNDPNGILKLVDGFSYQIISQKGMQMSDGLKVPDYADGMASFKGSNGKIILIRNHEIGHYDKLDKLLKLNSLYKEKKYLKKHGHLFYDAGKKNIPCCGGTTTLVYNPKTKELETEYMSLAGTLVNCSGGPTPWNTWISCEETMIKEDASYSKDHGYNFEVIPSEKIVLNKAIPLKDMGRFRHEAVAIDPKTNIAYQTEDRDDGLIYRFSPNSKKYTDGGRLQALVIKNKSQIDTRNWDDANIVIHKKYNVKWVDLNHVDSPDDDLRYRGYEKGAAVFARPEGMWHDNGLVYFTCTSGGKKKIGQIWKYNIKESVLELVFEPNNSNIMKKCDNLTISPWGDMIICEDGRGTDRIIGIKQDGSTYVIAENILNNSEFAGVNFSPDGQILFVNIYSPTTTIAITGPWKKLI